ncbi:MAG: HD domain-containing protein [Candidatus Heimdallarchaeota archaeon]|nr:HD domain-containing protein [Candidatus Heimdallarchaeota archaeon]
MNPKISRDEAINLISHTSHFNHSLRVGKMMLNLAKYFNENKNEWELVGLLHDLDYDDTLANGHLHGILAAEMLQEKLSDKAINAIKTHDYRSNLEPKTILSKALISVDALDNLIEILEKSGEKITSKIIINQLKNWQYEKPWLKDLIKEIETCNITIDKFIEVCLHSNI